MSYLGLSSAASGDEFAGVDVGRGSITEVLGAGPHALPESAQAPVNDRNLADTACSPPGAD